MELVFRSDTKHRKQWFTGLSFSHPAKMSLPLQFWLIDHYTKEGETILDPMGGSGTILVACSMGRNVITVELEDKYIRMQHGNWEKVKQRGPQMGFSMGTATILQGDSHNLENLLVDSIITSPPYAETDPSQSHMTSDKRGDPQNPNYRPSWKGKIAEGYCETSRPYVDKIITSPPYAEGKPFQDLDFMDKTSEDQSKRVDEGKIKGHSFTPEARRRVFEKVKLGVIENSNNIGNLKYGDIDAVITSPPYEESTGEKHHSPRADKLAEEKRNPVTYTDKGDIGGIRSIHHLFANWVDAVITSPPYEGSISGQELGQSEKLIERQSGKDKWGKHLRLGESELHTYSGSGNNIGNLKGQSYLEAMKLVYSQCWKVLKPNGLLILVVKNFIRNKAEVDLKADTRKLCESAGFTFVEEHYRRLSSQSFWRILYHQKYPGVPLIDKEYVLVFQK